MRMMVLGLAAGIAALAAAPAAAGTPGQAFAGSNGSGFHNGSGDRFTSDFEGGRFDRRFDRRRRGDGNLGIWVNGGEWAHYNNRAFSADSYNDWWHDQPNHSQPAWVRNNQDCQRQWFAGDTLRC